MNIRDLCRIGTDKELRRSVRREYNKVIDSRIFDKDDFAQRLKNGEDAEKEGTLKKGAKGLLSFLGKDMANPAFQRILPMFGIAALPVNNAVSKIWGPMYKNLVDLRKRGKIAHLDRNSKEFKFALDYANKARSICGFSKWKDGVQDSIRWVSDVSDEEIGEQAMNSIANNDTGEGSSDSGKNNRDNGAHVGPVKLKQVPTSALPSLLDLFGNFINEVGNNYGSNATAVKNIQDAFVFCIPEAIRVEYKKWADSCNTHMESGIPDAHNYGRSKDQIDKYFSDLVSAVNHNNKWDLTPDSFREHIEDYKKEVFSGLRSKFADWADNALRVLKSMEKEEGDPLKAANDIFEGAMKDDEGEKDSSSSTDNAQQSSSNNYSTAHKTKEQIYEETGDADPYGESLHSDEQQNAQESSNADKTVEAEGEESNNNNNNVEQDEEDKQRNREETENKKQRVKNLKDLRKARKEDSADRYTEIFNEFINSKSTELQDDEETYMNLTGLTESEYEDFINFAKDYMHNVGKELDVDDEDRRRVKFSI